MRSRTQRTSAGVRFAARLGEELAEARGARPASRTAQQVDQHQRALALPDVAVELLAVARRVADEVEQVVLDLERGAEEEAEAEEAVEIDGRRACRSARRRAAGRWSCTSRSS